MTWSGRITPVLTGKREGSFSTLLKWCRDLNRTVAGSPGNRGNCATAAITNELDNL